MKKGLFLDEPIVAIDIGTTKICVLVARSLNEHSFEIIGIGKSPSHGLSKGIVVDIQKTVSSIKKAVEEASLMAGISITDVAIGVSGSHIQALNSQGMVPLKKGVVQQSDIDAVLQSAQAIPISEGKQILHVLPQYYLIDGQRIQNPLGMHGIRLEANVHIIVGAVSCVQNLIDCCEQAGVQVKDIVLEQIASGMAVLSEDERRLGVGVLDIGGGTSDFALYQNNAIVYTLIIPVAGNHFTNDVALGLRTTLHEAERIKKEIGSVSQEQLSLESPFFIESVEGGTMRQVLTNDLHAILYWRAQELMQLLNQVLTRNSLKLTMPAGLVLTGGSSLLDGLIELTKQELQIPVRLGAPHVTQPFIQALDTPSYATGYGLLLYAHSKRNTILESTASGSLLNRITTRMKGWITDIF